MVYTAKSTGGLFLEGVPEQIHSEYYLLTKHCKRLGREMSNINFSLGKICPLNLRLRGIDAWILVLVSKLKNRNISNILFQKP